MKKYVWVFNSFKKRYVRFPAVFDSVFSARNFIFWLRFGYSGYDSAIVLPY